MAWALDGDSRPASVFVQRYIGMTCKGDDVGCLPFTAKMSLHAEMAMSVRLTFAQHRSLTVRSMSGLAQADRIMGKARPVSAETYFDGAHRIPPPPEVGELEESLVSTSGEHFLDYGKVGAYAQRVKSDLL